MSGCRLNHRGGSVVCALGLAAAVGAVAAAAPTTLRWSDPGFPDDARAIPIGGNLHIDDAILEAGGPPEALELERFRVFAPDARVVVHNGGETLSLPPPAHAYFRGTVTGRAGSRVMLTVLEDGGLRGLIAEGSGTCLLVGSSTNLVGKRIIRSARLHSRVIKNTRRKK